MPSEWAIKRADAVFRSLETPGYDDSDMGQFDMDTETIANALDAALEEGERRGAEKEREACARFCEVGDSDEYPIGDQWVAEDEEGRVRLQLAAAIRARGEATKEPKP